MKTKKWWIEDNITFKCYRNIKIDTSYCLLEHTIYIPQINYCTYSETLTDSLQGLLHWSHDDFVCIVLNLLFWINIFHKIYY